MKRLIIIFFCFFITHAWAQKTLGTDTIRINVTVAQAKTIVDTSGVNPDFVILDVRTPSEYCTHHIDNAININYDGGSSAFYTQIDALDHNKMYLLHCAAGSRSGPTFTHMQNVHFREVYHMNNGINAWISAGYPSIPCYTTVEKISGPNLFKLYPNPSQNILNIDFESEGTGKLFLSDLSGKVIKEEIIFSGLQNIDVSDIPKGIYIIEIHTDKEVFFEKIAIL